MGRPTLAFANRYKQGSDCVGWHSDHLNLLGPRPVIVGLSLGATRQFQLKPVTAGEDPMTVSIPMPHNTVVVMWDDCQEAWHHAVPRQAESTVGQHPRAGAVRLSLTFRMERPDFSGRHTKHCHCGRPTALRSKGGRYFLVCDPSGSSKQCGFWEACPWAQEEADRLRSSAFN